MCVYVYIYINIYTHKLYVHINICLDIDYYHYRIMQEKLGSSVKGLPLENELTELGYGFTRDRDGCIVMQPKEDMVRAWTWLKNHRHRILNEHNLTMDAVICGHMITAIKNIKKDFENVCFFLPDDNNRQNKRWVIVRAPWEHQKADERWHPAPPGKPPRKIVDRYKVYLSQRFLKETLATQQQQQQ